MQMYLGLPSDELLLSEYDRAHDFAFTNATISGSEAQLVVRRFNTDIDSKHHRLEPRLTRHHLTRRAFLLGYFPSSGQRCCQIGDLRVVDRRYCLYFP